MFRHLQTQWWSARSVYGTWRVSKLYSKLLHPIQLLTYLKMCISYTLQQTTTMSDYCYFTCQRCSEAFDLLPFIYSARSYKFELRLYFSICYWIMRNGLVLACSVRWFPQDLVGPVIYLPTFLRVASLLPGQSSDWPCASEVTLKL